MILTKKKIFNILIAVAGLLLLYYSWGVMIYIISSLVLALMLSPLNQFIRRLKKGHWGMNRSLAAATTMLIFTGFLLLMVNIFVPVVSNEISRLSNVDMDKFYEVLKPEMQGISGFLKSIQLEPGMEDKDEKEVIRGILLGKKNMERVPKFFSGVASGIGGGIVAIFSIFFITFFLLRDDNLFNEFVYSMSEGERLEKIKVVLEKVKMTLSRYFIGIFIQVSVVTCLVSIGLSLFGFKNAVVIGLFAGIMNVIPYVGPVIGAAFGLLIGISTNIDMASLGQIYTISGKILLVFGITQMVDNFVTQPIVFSRSISAHPLEIFLVVLFAGNGWGITGMIIAIPLYSVIRIIAKEYYSDSKFVQFMTQSMK